MTTAATLLVVLSLSGCPTPEVDGRVPGTFPGAAPVCEGCEAPE
ncbi:outer membrane protein assembly factor BamE (lipoprotein component of BamABCDE complex) [Microbacteriaceae bacterium SG_E_30_P1]|uniref:Outer membrane protein assembly factor BamE (Lipoprotein component of BamABCDE complex) n=1 Tax=Antiquaquibacter oligotrophicus TaxID=2880260 RepID=A0ABT6KJX1_9MICO|nr:hypothetical protein [Antiquaquibacter oligotrophicus]MDH6179981.1 outer membrane protein assembly factor BamE (lipoprotein component of BamABCDE complex) [Antiquaquibacter oligotrophicus]